MDSLKFYIKIFNKTRLQTLQVYYDFSIQANLQLLSFTAIIPYSCDVRTFIITDLLKKSTLLLIPWRNSENHIQLSS